MKAIMQKIKRFFFLRYLVLGLFIAFLYHSAGSCKKDTQLKETPVIGNVDVPINDAVKSVESAFKGGNVSDIKNVLTEDALKIYGDDLSLADKKKLIKFGEALKTRVLKVESDLYSEYNFTMGGTTFSISMAKQKDGTWKLMRF
jgi:hypothetical protein